MKNFPVTSDINNIPNASATLRNVYSLLAQNITGSIHDDALMPGQVGGDRPTADKGPYLKDRAWQAWLDNVGYSPVDYVIGTDEISTKLVASPSVNRIQQLPDMDGIIASTDDAAGVREGIRLDGTNVAVDFSASNNFLLVLNYPVVLIKPVRSSPGDKVKLLVVNQGTANSVIWDDSIKWHYGATTTIPAADSGETRGRFFIIRDIGGDLYGAEVGEYTTKNLGQGLPTVVP